MSYFKEKSSYILFVFLILALFITRPQLVYSQFDTDTERPEVEGTSPSKGQTNVPIDIPSIEVVFSESMDTVYLYNPFSISPTVAGQISWGQMDETLIFSPAILLGYNVSYQVTIDKQASDLSGKTLQNSYKFSFVTEYSPWLNVSSILGSSLVENNVKLIFGDVNGDVWVVLSSEGSSDELFVFNGFDPSSFSKINKSFGSINAIAQGSDDEKIWVATGSDVTNQGGIYVFDGKKNKWTQYNTSNTSIFSDNEITCLTIDSDNNIWVGSSESGIYMFNGSSWKKYNTDNTDMSSDWIIAIEAAEDDLIWIATLFGGIEVFDPETKNTLPGYPASPASELGISTPLINKLLAGSGKIWAVTNLGLLSYDTDSDQWDLYTQIGDYSINEGRLKALALDSAHDILWIGTEEGLITFDGVDPNTGDSILLEDAAGPDVREIAFDAYGNKLIGTSKSLSRYDTESPSLKDVSPSANKKNVSRGTKITLTFNEPMDMDSVINALSISPSATFTSSKDSGSLKLTISPKSKLNDNKKYTITVDETATDIQGHPLTQGFSWSFTTEKSTKQGTYPATVPSTAYAFPGTSLFGGFTLPTSIFGRFTGFPTTSAFTLPTSTFGRYTGFPTTSAFTLPTSIFGRYTGFPTTSAFTLPTSTFGRYTTPTFPTTSAWTYTASPFRNIGRFTYPY